MEGIVEARVCCGGVWSRVERGQTQPLIVGAQQVFPWRTGGLPLCRTTPPPCRSGARTYRHSFHSLLCHICAVGCHMPHPPLLASHTDAAAPVGQASASCLACPTRASLCLLHAAPPPAYVSTRVSGTHQSPHSTPCSCWPWPPYVPKMHQVYVI